MGPFVPQTAHQRRAQVRQSFETSVLREWRRHEGEPWRVLRRVLRERFLLQHLQGKRGTFLELGPGPGRFTPLVRARPRRSVVAVDLSWESLLAARRRSRSRPRLATVHWMRAAGERLPLLAGSVDGVVAFGNIISFASRDGPLLLGELARVTKPQGLFLADFPTPTGALQEFLHLVAAHRQLPRILRQHRFYMIDQVLDTGFQPLAPHRLGRWEFRFYTVEEARSDLEAAGFEVVDTMSVAPVARMDDRLISIARRDPRAWRSLLEIEEKVGRRPGVSETGDGFLLCAVRRSEP